MRKAWKNTIIISKKLESLARCMQTEEVSCISHALCANGFCLINFS